jgi:hypothetical protein
VTDSTGDDPLRLLGRRVPPAFELRVCVLPAGYAHPIGPVTWDDTLVEVTKGEIELEFTGGERRRSEPATSCGSRACRFAGCATAPPARPCWRRSGAGDDFAFVCRLNTHEHHRDSRQHLRRHGLCGR